MKQITVDIAIPADHFKALYSGTVKDVQVVSREGLRVRFPGHILKRYVDHEGVYGTFRIEFDESNKFRTITKIV